MHRLPYGQTTKALVAVNEDTLSPAGNTVTDLVESETSAYYDADGKPTGRCWCGG
jgi:hypothetical protein